MHHDARRRAIPVIQHQRPVRIDDDTAGRMVAPAATILASTIRLLAHIAARDRQRLRTVILGIWRR
jgi:hypothetical protein